MAVFKKQTEAPKRLADVPAYVEARAKLDGLVAELRQAEEEAEALRVQVGRFDREDAQIQIEARELAGADPAGELTVLSKKIERLGELERRAKVLGAATKMMETEVEQRRAEAAKLIRAGIMVEYKAAIHELAAKVLLAAKAANAVADILGSEAAAEVGNVPYALFTPLAGRLDDQSLSTPVLGWIRELTEQGLLDPSDSILKDTVIPQLRRAAG